ncbi:putative Transposon TX1 [Gossypium australe]|uniref:Putative Transposon TX1 n=1 Tax=Gossypium australe TaxID=47621 RepID=A0A5B6WPS8_9ROSI|nr:putative Transposon TX1 [Gossypium australe]
MEDSCEEEVKRQWEQNKGSVVDRFEEKKLRKELSRRLLAKLDNLDGLEIMDENLAELIDTNIQLNLEIEKEERYWEQRPRANWLKIGDKNTTVFHNFASQRRRITQIGELENEQGKTIVDQQGMTVVAKRKGGWGILP